MADVARYEALDVPHARLWLHGVAALVPALLHAHIVGRISGRNSIDVSSCLSCLPRLQFDRQEPVGSCPFLASYGGCVAALVPSGKVQTLVTLADLDLLAMVHRLVWAVMEVGLRVATSVHLPSHEESLIKRWIRSRLVDVPVHFVQYATLALRHPVRDVEICD